STSEALGSLGEVALAAGDLASAEGYFERALDIRREAAPGSSDEAVAWRHLATLARRRNDPGRALELQLNALDALEAQRRRLGGGDEAHSDFSAQYAGFYHEAVELLMQAGRSEQAFHVVERYRARGLLAMLAEGELVSSAAGPPERDRERRRATAEYARALARLGAAQGDRAAERAGLVQARRRQAAVEERIRAASPRLAALQYPEPLDLEGAR